MENAVAAADSDGRSKRAGAVIDDLATVDGR
jgi:hypothetical protein